MRCSNNFPKKTLGQIIYQVYKKTKDTLATSHAYPKRNYRGTNNYTIHTLRMVSHAKEMNSDSEDDTLKEMSKKLEEKDLPLLSSRG